MFGFKETNERVEHGRAKWIKLFREMAENGKENVVRERDRESDEEWIKLYKTLYSSADGYNKRNDSHHVCISKRKDKIFVQMWEV